jgi:Domain of Unknown Function (DUF1206)
MLPGRYGYLKDGSVSATDQSTGATGRHAAAERHDAMDDIHDAARSPGLRMLARLGLVARAIIYLLIGWVGLLIAAGQPATEADQRGAMQELIRHAGGAVLLWLVTVGLVGYALWRFSEAAFGVIGEDSDKKAPRVESFARGCVYAFLAATALNLLFSSGGGSQASDQQQLTARVLAHPWGRWLVGAVGLIVAVVGLVAVVQGVRRRFEKYLSSGQIPQQIRPVVRWLGVIGTVARGLVFTLVGIFVIRAAVDYDPGKARGLDGVLRSLAHTSAGPWLLVAASIGLILFGVYGLAEARWRRT